MKYLKIQNDGLLDIRLVALMGGTTKSKDEYKIGQFGTGLKYTLAFLFRNNLDFKIFAGNEEVSISLEKETIRDEVFEIICINNQRTSITTRMGEDWLAWMIVRELWCNALDEGGAVKEVTDETIGKEGTTTFYIQVDSQINDVIKNWDKYFIQETESISETEYYKIYPGGESLRLYKNGVLIHEDKTTPALYSYDIATASINELREYKGSASFDVMQALCGANKKIVSHFLECVDEKYYEGKSSTDWYNPFSEIWRECIGNAKLIHTEAITALESRGHKIKLDEYIVVPKFWYELLTKKFDGVGALYVAQGAGAFYEQYDPLVENQVNKAMAILETCDYPMDKGIQFEFGWFENKKVLAQMLIKEKKILFSNAILQRPIFEVTATIIEEYEHFNTGHADETREFQQHFINLYTRELLAKNAIEI